MDPKQAYDFWSSLYDTNKNNTRDLEAVALKETLADIPFNNVLEIGCGTGKNTGWLMKKAKKVLGVDLSPGMLEQARIKFNEPDVSFINADINEEWNFTDARYDLITFSLVLEHIESLAPVFKKAFTALESGGYVYVGELHPFKQYTGTKARFDTADGRQVVDCFNHHISDFTMAATAAGFRIIQLNEYFDTPDRNEIPRILTLVLHKP
ncbi:MAG: class I SAM-dependent methyltransferase [Chitinophagaceae bacterium]|nr:MAG: class I SAM-dependent methyltransferase [Chitinophagaceae bacterium]